jgi:hypothetical protein
MSGDEDPLPRPGLGATLGGCFAAVLLGMVLLLVPVFVAGWGGAHCDPVPACQQAATAYLRVRMAAALVPIALLGLSVRAVLHWVARRNLLGADEAGGIPALAIGGLIAALAASVLFLGWI